MLALPASDLTKRILQKAICLSFVGRKISVTVVLQREVQRTSKGSLVTIGEQWRTKHHPGFLQRHRCFLLWSLTVWIFNSEVGH